MGTSFLLFGYFFFCDFSIGVAGTSTRFDVIPDVFGWILLFVGCIFASRFSQKLNVAKYIAVVMLLPSLFSLLHGIGVYRLFYADFFFARIYPFFETLFKLLFHYYLLFGLRDVAEECGDQKALAVRLKGNFFMTLFCFFWIFAARVAYQTAPQMQGYCALIVAFSNMVYLIINALAIFKVYREITVE